MIKPEIVRAYIHQCRTVCRIRRYHIGGFEPRAVEHPEIRRGIAFRLDVRRWNRLDDVRAFNHTHGDAAYAEAPLRSGRPFGWRHHVAEHSFEPQLASSVARQHQVRKRQDDVVVRRVDGLPWQQRQVVAVGLKTGFIRRCTLSVRRCSGAERHHGREKARHREP